MYTKKKKEKKHPCVMYYLGVSIYIYSLLLVLIHLWATKGIGLHVVLSCFMDVYLIL